MRTAIDASGPLSPDVPLEVVVRDGSIIIEPAPTPMVLEEREGGVVAVPESELPPLTAEDVRRALEDIRR